MANQAKSGQRADTRPARAERVEIILVLKAGETPRQHSQNPGELTGPWGATVEEAVAIYTQDTGFGVVESWLEGDTLWIVSDEPTS